MKYEILKSNCRLVVLVYCCVDSYFELGINTITQQLREVNRLADYLYGVAMRRIKEQSWISNKHCFCRLDKLKVNITDLRLIFGIRRSTSSQKISKPPTSYFHCRDCQTTVLFHSIRGQLPSQGPVYDHPTQKNNYRVHFHSKILKYTQAERREQCLMGDTKKLRNSGKVIP